MTTLRSIPLTAAALLVTLLTGCMHEVRTQQPAMPGQPSPTYTTRSEVDVGRTIGAVVVTTLAAGLMLTVVAAVELSSSDIGNFNCGCTIGREHAPAERGVASLPDVAGARF